MLCLSFESLYSFPRKPLRKFCSSWCFGEAREVFLGLPGPAACPSWSGVATECVHHFGKSCLILVCTQEGMDWLSENKEKRLVASCRLLQKGQCHVGLKGTISFHLCLANWCNAGSGRAFCTSLSKAGNQGRHSGKLWQEVGSCSRRSISVSLGSGERKGKV